MAQIFSLYHMLLIALLTFAPAFALGVFLGMKYQLYAKAKNDIETFLKDLKNDWSSALADVKNDWTAAHTEIKSLISKTESFLDPALKTTIQDPEPQTTDPKIDQPSNLTPDDKIQPLSENGN